MFHEGATVEEEEEEEEEDEEEEEEVDDEDVIVSIIESVNTKSAITSGCRFSLNSFKFIWMS
jgi:hypothetical protein